MFPEHILESGYAVRSSSERFECNVIETEPKLLMKYTQIYHEEHEGHEGLSITI